MLKRLSNPTLFFVCCIVLFCSCADIQVVKRRHLPGYHVNLGGKTPRPACETAVNSEVRQSSSESDLITSNSSAEESSTFGIEHVNTSNSFVASSSQDLQETIMHTSKSAWQSNARMLEVPIVETKKTMLNAEFKRSVFHMQDEKVGWSVVAITSTGLGAIALAMVIIGIAFLVSFIVSGGFPFWWIFSLIGLLFGIAAMVTGIIGLRQTGRKGEKRGKGFAIGGMVAGIVSLVLGLVGLFWGMLFQFINNRVN